MIPTTEQRLALAATVLNQTKLLEYIPGGENQARVSKRSLRDLVELDTPYCGHVTNRKVNGRELLVGDYDTNNGIVQARRDAKWLESQGFEPVYGPSGSKGNRAHLFCWVDVRAVDKLETDWARLKSELPEGERIERRTGNRGIRPLGTMHRSGERRSEPLNVDWDEAVRRLASHQPAVQRWQDVVLDDTAETQRKGRHKAIMRGAYRAKAQGATYEEFKAVVAKSTKAQDEAWSDAQLERHARKTWDRAISKGRKASPDVTAWCEAAERADVPPRLKRMVTYLVEIARKSNASRFHLSTRTASRLGTSVALMSTDTANRNLHAIASKLGMIKLEGMQNPEQPMARDVVLVSPDDWKISKSRTHLDSHSLCSTGDSVRKIDILRASPCFADAFKGQTVRAAVISEVVVQGVATVESLSSALDMKPEQVRDHVRKLVASGAAIKEKRTVRPSPDLLDVLEGIAKLRDTHGDASTRTTMQEVQRKGYADLHERYKARRSLNVVKVDPFVATLEYKASPRGEPFRVLAGVA
jgi:hypothetical protein